MLNFKKIWIRIRSNLRPVNLSVVFVDTHPIHDELLENKVYIVKNNSISKWILMKCPCGCMDTITLSLMKTYRPNWKMSIDKKKRITLNPSIWKQEGCESHFFIIKNKVKWVRI